MWVRVISKEGGQTIYWKGNQASDAVKTDQSNWSTSGIGGDGYFSTYKINPSGSTQTFNKTINRISDEMNVEVRLNSSPGDKISGDTYVWQVMSEGCKAGPVTLAPHAFPAGIDEYWSNQYCGGGQPTGLTALGAPEHDGNDNQENRMWCVDKREGCNNPDIKGCSIWCSPPGLDGCGGKFTVPEPNPNPGETTRDNGSMGMLSAIIEANNGAVNGVDLGYDGAWTMSQRVFTKIEGATDFYHEVRITPPTGYTCGDAQQLWAKAINNSPGSFSTHSRVIKPAIEDSGTCVYNAGNTGGIILPELIKQTVNMCEVIVSKGSASSVNSAITVNVNPKGGADPISISAYGLSNDTRTANAGVTRLWFANGNHTPFILVNSTKDLVAFYGSSKFYAYDYTTPTGRRAYMNQTTCSSSNLLMCNPMISMVLNQPINDDRNYTLKPGTYMAWCDMQYAPASTGDASTDGRCSGQPFCSFNQAKLNQICGFLGLGNCAALLPAQACSGFRGCDVAPTSASVASDIAVIKAECIPYCNKNDNACDLTTDDDGCGGTCAESSFCTGGSRAQLHCTSGAQCPGIGGGVCQPFASNNFTPSSVTNVTTTSLDMCATSAFTVSWNAPATSDANTWYEMVLYRPTLYASPDAALAAWTPTSTAVKRYYGTARSATYNASVLTAMGPNLTAAIRAENPQCGITRSGWATQPIRLTCSTSPQLTVQLMKAPTGGVDADATGRCIGPIGDLIPQSYQVTASLPSPAPFGLTSAVTVNPPAPTQTLSGGAYRFTNLWYLPSTAADGHTNPYRITLNRNPAELAIDNLVLDCPTPSAGNDPFQSLYVPDSTSMAGYVRFYVKEGFSAWWRATGGLLGAASGDIFSNIPESCDEHATCIDSLSSITSSPSQTSTGATAGVPIAGQGGGINAGVGWRTQNRTATNDERYAVGSASLSLSTDTGYDHFMNKVSESTSGWSTDRTLLQNSGPVQDAARTTIQGDSYYVWRISEDSTFNINGSEWSIGDNKVVVLVDGNATFTRTNSTVSVGSLGFLMVVASGNIVFDNTVGRDVSAVEVNDAAPIVTGIFVSQGQLQIQGTGGETVRDNQFVGKGVFAGLGGVVLGRSFDGSGDGRILNNLQPAELFIHDPQLVLNTPKFLKDPEIQFKEIQ